MAQVRNMHVILKDHVSGFPKESDMNIVESSITLKLPEGSNDVLLKNLYLSCDPFMRNLMNKQGMVCLKSWSLDTQIIRKVIWCGGLLNGKSTAWSPQLKYFLRLNTLMSHYPTILEFLVDLLKNKFGFDGGFNYKEEPDLNVALKRNFPEGIDVYFENVGGKTLDAVLLNMRVHGRIPACGMISQYNLTQHEGVTNLAQIIFKRIRMEGFNAMDFCHLYPKFIEFVLPHIREGKIVYVEDVAEGLENGPAALVGLFSGCNVGKQVLVVARE